MNVYDTANELAKEMRATREFSVLKEAKERLAAEPDTKISCPASCNSGRK